MGFAIVAESIAGVIEIRDVHLVLVGVDDKSRVVYTRSCDSSVGMYCGCLYAIWVMLNLNPETCVY